MTVVNARAEEWPDGLGAHDLVTARALAALPVLCEYAAPLLAEGGQLVAWKGAVGAAGGGGRRRGGGALGPRAARGRAASTRTRARATTRCTSSARSRPRRRGSPPARNCDETPAVCDVMSADLRHSPLAERPFGAESAARAASVDAQMSVYAIANQKGGVGKTTTAVNVAACIAAAGYETLVVDVDPQGNATVGLGVARDGGPGPLRRARRRRRGGRRGPADPDRAASRSSPRRPTSRARTWSCRGCPGSENRLRDALAPMRDDYAFVLLDCPPSLGPLTINALVAADRVIVPVQTEYFALEGLAGLLDTLSLVQRELNPRLTVAGMLLTMHDARTKLAQDVEREVREHFPSLVFDTVIPRNVRLGEAPSFGRPRHPSRPALRGLGGVLRARQGGGLPWLSAPAAWAAASPRSCPRPSRRPRAADARTPSCARSRSS